MDEARYSRGETNGCLLLSGMRDAKFSGAMRDRVR